VKLLHTVDASAPGSGPSCSSTRTTQSSTLRDDGVPAEHVAEQVGFDLVAQQLVVDGSPPQEPRGTPALV
jgi:hypothetical protein